mmetsp:Transcript_27097/g.40742  ORF Transcript_27097/g.40742 Transcript_27097/m.40742 type:complete len:1257 (+) Transcript_27097:197-3967(+)|eukprot:CAMPEP_0203667554 /NCGR_PEP_ID=MMETSP0090-20130426/4379_1 /ASSEMBLY_ACC=CAM_ASM_001088 /TAXON_ID=426623 /ORGANISM="Chaetoceros affinis, Strain CCMP159" /LENGTH=1256 /DNA_ID=CAMNT_0050531753 /DNA_START=76 /DNA_END=3846 /DNA_ORIENTATION=+
MDDWQSLNATASDLWCPCNSTGKTFSRDDDIIHSGINFHDSDQFESYNNLGERFVADVNRRLSENGDEPKGELWQIIYVSIVLFLMFVALISDQVGADLVMVGALTLLLAPGIISIQEGLAGFANEGLLTVLVLFVVAAGISHTGALDWYMGKLLGRPTSTASAQLRLMIPIAIISAFLNNTPVVVVMIPIVQRWGKNVGVSPQQLLMPLSFASILGGTCTLIGTSTNLVVVGLLQARYPGDEVSNVGLFDLGIYGVPIAFAGMVYFLLFSEFLVPGGSKFIGGDGNRSEVPADLDESILLGARLTKWSPAANRTVKRSGLRDTGGLYLVSVHRAATGNVHRAVGQDFVLNVGDVLYFTGLVEEFGKFCQENSLEVMTNEIEDSLLVVSPRRKAQTTEMKSVQDQIANEHFFPTYEDSTTSFQKMELGINKGLTAIPEVYVDIGETKESLVQTDAIERQRYINRLQDVIRGIAKLDTIDGFASSKNISTTTNAPTKIIAVADKDDPAVVVGVNTRDRPGLLLDVSKTLIRLGLNVHRTEAMVLDGRSLSLWRCEVMEDGVSDIEEIWSVLNAMLEINSGIEAIKHRGIRIVRAIVPKKSSLVGVTALDINFREQYKCAIIAVQRDGKSPSEKLSQIRFAVGDVLVLQVNDDSPLLIEPPKDFYKKKGNKGMTASKSNNSLSRFVRKRFGSFSSLDSSQGSEEGTSTSDRENKKMSPATNDSEKGGNDNFFFGDVESVDAERTLHEEAPQVDDVETPRLEIDTPNRQKEVAWNDLAVVFTSRSNEEEPNESQGMSREFLTAMQIVEHSSLANGNAESHGLDKLPGIFLVSIERPTGETLERKPLVLSNNVEGDLCSTLTRSGSLDEKDLTTDLPMIPLSKEEPLKGGDILWFSGTAASIGDLRKIPGMKSYVNEEVKKINEKVYDRRLVQAVIARRAKLVGKTVKEAKFRTRYGAAVISVHREGKRVQEHPGKIKLQAGDVLLLEAGPSFLKQNADKDNSFSLLSEVEDSAPPRLKLLIPALLLSVAMLAVYTAGVASLLVCALVASMLMVASGILSQQEVRDAINWEIYITIACAFGIGSALTNSGVAGAIADGLVTLGQAVGIGDAGLFGAVYFATFLISNVVTNNAAAALLFPIAMDAAETTGTDKQLMSYILMLGASASFMSPFGYTTNLLIYGPGGYKYVDFLRIGTPMQVVLWILSVFFIVIDPSKWYISWIATFAALVITSFALTVGSSNIFSTFKLSKKQLSEEMTQLK